MGAWSTTILGNDTSADVAHYFKRMYYYQEGGDYKWSVEEIADSLYTYYYDTIGSLPSEKCNVFFVIALSLWQKGELTENIKAIVQRLVYEKIDYNAWKDLDADEKTLKSRWLATTKFCEALDTKYEKGNKRELKPGKVSLFVCGDCLAYKYNDHYYGIVVANDGRNADDGSNELLFVNIKSKSVPKPDDFKNTNPLLNEDLINHFSGKDNTIAEQSNVAYVIRLGKSGMKSLQKSALLVGRLPFTRTFFESSSLRFTSYNSEYKSAVKMAEDALAFWSQHQWNKSDYKLVYDCTVAFNPDMLKDDCLFFGNLKFKLKDISVNIDNSLWHINVTIRANHSTLEDIEKCWTYFTGFFEYLTGREVNLISIADETDEDLLPFAEIDFNKFKMKHVRDQGIV